MNMHMESLIRAAQDILSLTRQMQETWLFGKLDTIGESKVERRTEEDVKVVAGLLGGMIEEADRDVGYKGEGKGGLEELLEEMGEAGNG